MSSNYKKNI